MLEYKKRDRTAETYFYCAVNGQGKDSRTWIVRCKCGRENTFKADGVYASKSCKSYSKKISIKNLEKFPVVVNDLAPKRSILKPDEIYEFEYYQCLYPLFGKVVNEYQQTACFVVVDCNNSDREILKNLNNKVIVNKSKTRIFCE